MVTAIGLGVIGRWANNQKALPSAAGTIQVLVALGVVALADQGRTRPVAQGLAWLFFAAVMLSDNSPITGLAKVSGAAPAAAPGSPVANQSKVPPTNRNVKAV
jgi:hypothetical protein